MKNKCTYVSILLLISISLFSQHSPKVSFEKSHEITTLGSDLQICYNVENTLGNSFQAKIKYLEEYENKVSDFISENVDWNDGLHCFTVQVQNIFSTNEELISNGLKIVLPEITDVEFGDYPTFQIIVSPDTNDPDEILIPELLINGFDNQLSEGYSVSFINTTEIVQGQSIGLTNAVFDQQNGLMDKNGGDIQYVNLTYWGNETISPYSQICISKQLLSTEELFIKINDEYNANWFINDQLESNPFPIDDWETLYLFSGEIQNGELNGSIEDGITFGIVRSIYPYDFPFSNHLFQHFFFEEPDSEYAFVHCVDLPTDCELVEYIKDSSNWVSGVGDDLDQLEINGVCRNNCETMDCNNDVPQASTNCLSPSIDILFLLDESGSISNAEFRNLKYAIKSAAEEIKCLVPDSKFAFSAFSGENTFHIIESFDYNVPEVLSYQQQGGNTNVSSAYSSIIDLIDNQEILIRPEASFYIILLTDAESDDWFSIEPVNELKDEPYNGKNIIAYYYSNSTIDALPIAGAFASKGGYYFDNIINNPNDPEGPGVPRQLYQYNQMLVQIDELVEGISDCERLSFDIDLTSITSYSISTEDGLIVEEINAITFITSGIGTYNYSVTLENGCEYHISYSYPESENCNEKQYQQEIRPSKPRKALSEAELNDLSEENSVIDVFPNPANNIVYYSTQENILQIDIANINGERIESFLYKDKRTNYIDFTNYPSGMYLIKFYTVDNKTLYKKIIISKL